MTNLPPLYLLVIQKKRTKHSGSMAIATGLVFLGGVHYGGPQLVISTLFEWERRL